MFSSSPNCSSCSMSSLSTSVRYTSPFFSPRPFPYFLTVSLTAASTSASSIVEGNLYSSPSMIFLRMFLRILPLLVFGSLSTISTCWKEATGPICFLMRATSYFSIPSAEKPVLITTNPIGISPLSSSTLATTAASETEGWQISSSSMLAVESRCPAVLIMSSSRVITLRQPSSSKQPASPVVQQPGVSSRYFLTKASSLLQRVSMNEGGMGNLMQTLPRAFRGMGLLSWLMISTLKPGQGLVALPGLGLKVWRFLQLQDMIHPHSVCQQLSLMSTFSLSSIHWQVGMSHLSPAIDTHARLEISYLPTHDPSLSSFRIALRAVGLVYRPFTLYFSTICHSTPGLGSIGFPSYSTVAAPLKSGPYTVKLWPTTHPMSLAAKQVSIALIPMI